MLNLIKLIGMLVLYSTGGEYNMYIGVRLGYVSASEVRPKMQRGVATAGGGRLVLKVRLSIHPCFESVLLTSVINLICLPSLSISLL